MPASKRDTLGQPPLNSEQMQFIEEYSTLLSPWGLPPAAGRVLGYLVLVQTAASVDELAERLSMSRVGAYNSAKSLETFGHVKRFSTAGSKLVLFAASDDCATPLKAQAELIGKLASLLNKCSVTLASAEAVPGINNRAALYQKVSEAMLATLANSATKTQ